jgi:hypothetical protein
VIQEESAAGGSTAVPPPCRSRRIGGYNRCRFRSQDEIPSRILHGKTLPPLHRRNDGVSTGPERFTIRKSAYLQRTPSGRRAGEGRTREVSIFLLGDVVSGLRRQSPANASYNVPEMLRLLAAQGISSGFTSTLLRIGRRKQFLNSMLSHLTLLMSADSQRGPWLASA